MNIDFNYYCSFAMEAGENIDKNEGSHMVDNDYMFQELDVQHTGDVSILIQGFIQDHTIVCFNSFIKILFLLTCVV